MLQLTHALTSIRHVNKTDVVTLGSSFGVRPDIYKFVSYYKDIRSFNKIMSFSMWLVGGLEIINCLIVLNFYFGL